MVTRNRDLSDKTDSQWNPLFHLKIGRGRILSFLKDYAAGDLHEYFFVTFSLCTGT